MRLENSLIIQRPPQDVFKFLSEFENVPLWNYAIVETRKTSRGPVNVGATYRQLRLIPTRSEEYFRVTEFDPDRRVAIHGDIGPFKGTFTYVLEAVDHGTRLLNTAELDANGLLRAAAPIAAGRIRRAVAQNLQKLKHIIESGPRSSERLRDS